MKLTSKEKRDLNLISLASFDLFSKNAPKPIHKHSMVRFVKNFHRSEKKELREKKDKKNE
jgi:hypothetical protein